MFTTYIIILALKTLNLFSLFKYNIKLLYMNYGSNNVGKNPLKHCLFWVYLWFFVNVFVLTVHATCNDISWNI